MITRVLVPMDDSVMAEHALEFALDSYPDAEVTVLHVVGGPSPFMGGATALALADDLDEAANELAEPIFERARELAARRDREIETAVALGQPSRAIIERAAEYDVVVIGSHGRDLKSRVLMGDVADRVSRRSPVPVTVVR